jgi:hypothetical protein
MFLSYVPVICSSFLSLSKRVAAESLSKQVP